MSDTHVTEGLAGGGRPAEHRKILVIIGMNYRDDGSFWYREAGLLVRGLRALGHDAWLVAFGDEQTQDNPDKPLLTAPQAVLETPEWWKRQAPDGVVSMMWGARRFAPIRTAALQATFRFIEKLDTDGVRSPRVWFWQYVQSFRASIADSDAAAPIRWGVR